MREAELARWEGRYAEPGYLFGTEPNGFLVREADRIPTGADVLCVADGEGRNGVWLAQRGCRVHAIDVAENGLAKARSLADERGVPRAAAACDPAHVPGTIAIERADVTDWTWPEARYDAIVAIFIQFATPEERTRIFAGMERALKPGGVLLLEGYGPKQIEYGTGGPKVPEQLYSVALLETAFPTLETLLLEEEEKEVHEGPGHDGMSALIHFVARRP